MALRDRVQRWRWLATEALDRLRLRLLQWQHPGLEVHPSATPAFAVARFNLAPGARVVIGPRAATERRPGLLNVVVHAGGEIVLEEGAWLRTEIAPVNLVAFPGGRLVVGSEVMLNGCSVSAKRSVTLARRAIVGPGSRIYDSDQHDLDDARPERIAPVAVGEYAWIASDVTVVRGVTVGAHAVVGARSLVTRDVPPHALAFGAPAEVRGPVGDRTHAR